jgi:hypothetical protein
MNLGWFGVPPLGGWNGSGRLKPGHPTDAAEDFMKLAQTNQPVGPGC